MIGMVRENQSTPTGTVLICSKLIIKSTLINNRYPEVLISACFRHKIAGFRADKKIGTQKCLDYRKLSYIDNVSLRFEIQINTAIKKCSTTLSHRLVFSCKKILPSIPKGSVPTKQNSLVVYEYSCRCDAR